MYVAPVTSYFLKIITNKISKKDRGLKLYSKIVFFFDLELCYHKFSKKFSFFVDILSVDLRP